MRSEGFEDLKGYDNKTARTEFLATIPKVVSALALLLSAASDSIHDILELLRVLTYFKSNFPNEPEMPQAISKALTLVFNPKEQIRNGIHKFFSETYFNKKEPAKTSVL